MKRRVSCWIAAILAGLLSPGVSGAAEAPRVVASVKPIHSLVAAVMSGVGEPALLLPGNASPHAYAMRPSKAELIRRADIVFWVGLELESFLKGPLAALGKNAEIVALMDHPGMRLLKARQGGIWAPKRSSAAKAGDGRKGHDHGHGEFDPHLWLDPANAATIARIAAAKLSVLDTENAARYSANADRVVAEVKKLDAEIRMMTKAVAAKPYVVFHDAYQYFENRYRLNAIGAISASPERRPGARRMVAIRKIIPDRRIRCVFAEPQFQPSLVNSLTLGTGAQMAYLDPIGINVQAGPTAYHVVMANIAHTIVSCLSSRDYTNKAGK